VIYAMEKHKFIRKVKIYAVYSVLYQVYICVAKFQVSHFRMCSAVSSFHVSVFCILSVQFCISFLMFECSKLNTIWDGTIV
jgi:hypothetical protein